MAAERPDRGAGAERRGAGARGDAAVGRLGAVARGRRLVREAVPLGASLARARTATPAPHGSGAGVTTLLLVLAGISLAGGAVVVARRRTRAPRGRGAVPARVAPLPSDPGRGWTAEIEWRLGESDS